MNSYRKVKDYDLVLDSFPSAVSSTFVDHQRGVAVSRSLHLGREPLPLALRRVPQHGVEDGVALVVAAHDQETPPVLRDRSVADLVGQSRY